jgi:hypothetical protein
MYLLYLGLEPFVRKLWPSMLVTWTRVLTGRLRDPLIGRDALLGVAAGATFALVALMRYFTAAWLGRPAPPPNLTEFGALLGLRGMLATLLQSLNSGMQSALINVFTYSVFRAMFEWVTRTPIGAAGWTIAARLRIRETASDYVFVVCAMLVAALTANGGGATGVERYLISAQAAVFTLLMLLVLLRLGIFAMVMMLVTAAILQRMPLTFDSAALYVSGTWVALALLLGVAAAGFRLATQGVRS